MIKIENVVMPSPAQWMAVIRGMRNPKNSWDLSDSYPICTGGVTPDHKATYDMCIGPNDKKLMKNLANAGSDHGKYRRMIPVYLDIVAPLYWWKEFDTYKVGTVANSCSTMHKIHAKEFVLEDFSFENLIEDPVECRIADLLAGSEMNYTPREMLEDIIFALNRYRERYIELTNTPLKDGTKRADRARQCWDQMIQLLPTSYNQRRTVMLNYEVLANIYHARKNHKLAEWHVFCKWIESLPHSDLIIGG